MAFSLWKQNKGNDYYFFDRTISEYFRISGVSVFLHKYLGAVSDNTDEDTTSDYNGTSSNTDSTNITDIQDQFFKENRDRLYDNNVYEMKALYNMQETEMDLSQFGLFLANDTLFLEFHLNDCLKQIGRKIVAGDVFEMYHMRDDALLDPSAPAINKFYAVDQVTRAVNGWDANWLPHILRVRMEPITNSQEYNSILSKSVDDQVGGKNNPYGLFDMGLENPLYNDAAYLKELNGDDSTNSGNTGTESLGPNENNPQDSVGTDSINGTSNDDTTNTDGLTELTIGDIISNSGSLTKLTNAMLKEAQGYVPYRNFETRQLYMVPSEIMTTEYPWIFAGDGVPPNGAKPIGSGKVFPNDAKEGDWFLNTSESVAELFQYINGVWRFREVDLRLKWEASHRILTSYINNDNKTTLDDGSVINEKIAVSKAVLPKADF